MKLALRLWWHNNVKRPWYNWRFTKSAPYQAWIAEGRDPRLFPRVGKIKKKHIAWAESVNARKKS